MRNKSETVVLITGTSSGIGLATAKRFAEEGYQVLATSRDIQNRSGLMELAKTYPNVRAVELDVTNKEKEIQKTIQSLPPIDILINNAGVGLIGAAESFTEEQILGVITTNVLGVVNVTNAILPSMRERKVGMILTLSSLVGPMPDLNQWVYSGSKAMLEHYTAALKRDFAQNGYSIKIANIHPGPVLTNFEHATREGERFATQEDPYPEMKKNKLFLRNLLKNGRPVLETVNTIMRVIDMENPPFWNPTEEKVAQNFANVFNDPSGKRFSEGPSDVSLSIARHLGKDGLWRQVENEDGLGENEKKGTLTPSSSIQLN